ncbi:MAG: DUF4430 domain-containing protein [Candidatus Aenigmarchaeota archaeon]|nr:DUF4430 domain-containing protein [Candidatus Aenigmarchaeota archaeon]
MQKLVFKNKDPFEPEVKFEDFVSEEKNPLREALSKLFGSLVMTELEQEERGMEIEIDEEKKMIKFKVEKRKRKRRLEKIGNTYKLRKELERDVLTLVYNLPIQETARPFEKPEIIDRQKMHAKLFSAGAIQSKQIVDDIHVKEESTPQIKSIEIPQEFDVYKETYDKKFNTLKNDGGYDMKISYEEMGESVHYENPQKFFESELTWVQLPEAQESRQLTVYRIIALQGARTGETVLDLLWRSGYRFSFSVDKRYGVLITSIDGIPNGYNGANWEFYVNGKLANVGVSNYVLKDGDVVTFRLMKGGPCSQALS